MVYSASHRAGQLGETAPPRPFCYAAQSELIPALKGTRITTTPHSPRSHIHYEYCYVWSCTAFDTDTLSFRCIVAVCASLCCIFFWSTTFKIPNSFSTFALKMGTVALVPTVRYTVRCTTWAANYTLGFAPPQKQRAQK